VTSGPRRLTRAAALAALMLASIASAPTAHTQDNDGGLVAWWKRRAEPSARITLLDPRIEASVTRLRQGSPSFEQGWRDLERSRKRVVVGEAKQLSKLVRPYVPADARWMGVTVMWSMPGGGGLSRAAIAIQLDEVERLFAPLGQERVDREVDRLVAHEVYGHLVPVVQAGGQRGHCGDARRGERQADSCVGHREKRVLDEIDGRSAGDDPTEPSWPLPPAGEGP
jgi:hypothetical protein